MTKKQKRAWDAGFESRDEGRGRDHFPRSLSSVEILSWISGWELADKERPR